MKKLLALFLFLTFNVLAEKEKQKLNLKADEVNFVNNQEGARYIEAKGNIEVLYSDYELCSTYITIDEAKDEMIVKGDVKAEVLKGEGGLINTSQIKSNKGFTKAEIEKFEIEKQQLYGMGEGGEKNDDLISLKKVKVSTCGNGRSGGRASWSFLSNTLEYNVEKDEIVLYNSFFQVKDIPVFWFPYFRISPSRTHGFLAPKLKTNANEISLFTPYFITEKTKTHYFLITPQFVLAKQKPENESTVNNIDVSYTYTKDVNTAFLRFRIAPNAYTQEVVTGNALDEKADRYSFNSNLDFDYKSINYGFNYNKISDRFFPRTYDDLKTENYFVNNVFVNYFNPESFELASAESASFVPIGFEKDSTLPQVDFYGNYYKSMKLKSLNFYIELNTINFSRDEGVKHNRLSGNSGFVFNENFGKIKTEINPDLRIDYYVKNYENANFVNGENDYLVRTIPSIFISNKIENYYEFKDSKDFLFKLEPSVNFKLTRENLNNGRISDEDSGTSFLNSNNILSKKYIVGYDLIDEGFSTVYGIGASALHKKSNTSLEVFTGQRFSRLITISENFESSDHVGKVKLQAFNFLSFDSDLIFSKSYKPKYASNSVNFYFSYFSFTFSNLFIDPSLLTANSIEVNENRYTGVFNIVDKKLKFSVTVIQNNNFQENDGQFTKKIVGEEYLITNTVDCFEYGIGLSRERYSKIDLNEKYKFIFSFRLLGV